MSTLADIDIDEISRLIAETAAEEIMPRFRRLEAGDVSEKSGPQDLVTAADLASEARLDKALRTILPGSVVVGEEAAAQDPRVLDRLTDEAPVWIVDPLDGTLNFTEGKPEFVVLVALVHRGETLAGWIHHPVRGLSVSATRGAGAWRDGNRLQVLPAAAPDEMTGALYIGARRTPELYERLKRIRDRLGPRSHTRCAGAEYLAMVLGTGHYAIFTRLLPWDHAAGVLIQCEAGGHGARLDGRAYRPAEKDGVLLMAPDEPSWQALRALFCDEAGVVIPD